MKQGVSQKFALITHRKAISGLIYLLLCKIVHGVYMRGAEEFLKEKDTRGCLNNTILGILKSFS